MVSLLLLANSLPLLPLGVGIPVQEGAIFKAPHSFIILHQSFQKLSWNLSNAEMTAASFTKVKNKKKKQALCSSCGRVITVLLALSVDS